MITKPIYISSEDHSRLQRVVNAMLEGEQGNEPLKQLQAELKRAVVLDPSALPQDVVTLYTKVRLKDLEDGEIDEWILTMPEEADVDKNQLSILAPIGTAIIGLALGDEFDWETPGGVRKLRIESVEHVTLEADKPKNLYDL